MAKNGTYIWVQKKTKKRLDKLKQYPRQSYNTVIERFLDSFDNCSSPYKQKFLEGRDKKEKN